MDAISVPQEAVTHRPDLVRCFRHEGVGCLRCDGSGYQSRGRCAGCGESSGRPSEGGKALMGLRNDRSRDGLRYCLDCHPELGGSLGRFFGLLEDA